MLLSFSLSPDEYLTHFTIYSAALLRETEIFYVYPDFAMGICQTVTVRESNILSQFTQTNLLI